MTAVDLVARVRGGVVGGTGQDLVIFCGSGATAAVAKLVGLLELAGPPVPAGPRPVVFVGPYEHHSNLLPWRESAAEVVAVGEDGNGQVDLDELEALLVRHAGRPLLVGAFSAASNVTGILTDTDRLAALLHRHGAVSVWDYSAAAPYLPIRMAASAPGAGDHKDPGRRAAPRGSSSRSGPGWSWPSSRPSGPT
jgi:selenocysteine lyase/cysteine desulfurase